MSDQIQRWDGHDVIPEDNGSFVAHEDYLADLVARDREIDALEAKVQELLTRAAPREERLYGQLTGLQERERATDRDQITFTLEEAAHISAFLPEVCGVCRGLEEKLEAALGEKEAGQ